MNNRIGIQNCPQWRIGPGLERTRVAQNPRLFATTSASAVSEQIHKAFKPNLQHAAFLCEFSHHQQLPRFKWPFLGDPAKTLLILNQLHTVISGTFGTFYLFSVLFGYFGTWFCCIDFALLQFMLAFPTVISMGLYAPEL